MSQKDQTKYFQEITTLDHIFQTLLLSPTFRAMLIQHPSLADIPLSFDILKDNASEIYCSGDKKARIHDTRFNPQKENLTQEFNAVSFVWVAAHELRHAWQDIKGIFRTHLRLDLENQILLTRLYEADAVAFQTTVCWELKEIGYSIPWNHLINHPEYRECAKAFEKWEEAFPYSVQDGRAQKQAFLSWFQQENLRLRYARNICDFFDKTHKKHKDCFEKNSLSCQRDLLKGVIAHLAQMPYMAKNGQQKNRSLYLSENGIRNPERNEYRYIDPETKTRITQLHLKHRVMPELETQLQNVRYI
ncbi:MAG: hypothetical protein MRY79_09005 [Alphaproteobacteria bacterium]|nr:hypothetical protein [Alphaproteobacteria bacterium]